MGQTFEHKNADGVDVTNSTSGIGYINPIRYRGYYYDNETGFYYLQSRYYDPTVGRFLNADDPAYLGVSGSVLGWNLFAYCENDGVMNADADGYVVFSFAVSIGAAVVLGLNISIT